MHPLYCKQYDEKVERFLVTKLRDAKVVAFGEIGLDFHEFGAEYAYAGRELQLSVFERQLQLHAEHARRKPLVIHCREAEEETFAMMSKYLDDDLMIDVHCYTSSLEFALRLLERFRNVYFGFTGIVTFRNSAQLCKVVEQIPLSRILIETGNADDDDAARRRRLLLSFVSSAARLT